MKLAFKNKWGSGYSEKDVPILLRFGAIESLCMELGIDFFQIDGYIKKNNYDFMSGLLWHGYLFAMFEDLKTNKKAKIIYTEVDAIFWWENISQKSKDELNKKMIELSGEIKKMAGPKKKVN